MTIVLVVLIAWLILWLAYKSLWGTLEGNVRQRVGIAAASVFLTVLSVGLLINATWEAAGPATPRQRLSWLLIANRAIPVGARIVDDDLRRKLTRADSLSDAIAEPSEALGAVAAHGIAAGHVLNRSDVVIALRAVADTITALVEVQVHISSALPVPVGARVRIATESSLTAKPSTCDRTFEVAGVAANRSDTASTTLVLRIPQPIADSMAAVAAKTPRLIVIMKPARPCKPVVVPVPHPGPIPKPPKRASCPTPASVLSIRRGESIFGVAPCLTRSARRNRRQRGVRV